MFSLVSLSCAIPETSQMCKCHFIGLTLAIGLLFLRPLLLLQQQQSKTAHIKIMTMTTSAPAPAKTPMTHSSRSCVESNLLVKYLQGGTVGLGVGDSEVAIV